MGEVLCVVLVRHTKCLYSCIQEFTFILSYFFKDCTYKQRNEIYNLDCVVFLTTFSIYLPLQ